ncbi:pilus assembly protein PilZ [Pseudomonas syringae pv. syringae]|nr:pilus assembly protein PilZ [Pseudomonas syringae pv. syringae]
MSTLDEAGRREYYRIDDSVALEINPLSAADQASQDAMQDTSTLFDLLSELHVSEFESQHLMRQLDERDRVLNSFLKSLSKRIDLLGEVVAHTALGKLGAPQPVGEQLSIKMVLMPQAAGLMLRARVSQCDTLADGNFYISTEFVNLPDAQRQLLARHVLQRQAQQRRQALEQGQPSGN